MEQRRRQSVDINYQYVTPQLYRRIREYREEFHRYPECGWTEYRTSWRIADRLTELGFEVFAGESVCGSGTGMGIPEEESAQEYEQRACTEGVPKEVLAQMRGGRTGVVGVLRGSRKDTGDEHCGDRTYAGDRDCEAESGENAEQVIAFRFDIDALPIQEERTVYNASYRSLHEGVMHACGHDGHAAVGLGLAEILSQYRNQIDGEIRLIFQPAEEGCRGAAAIVSQGWLDDVDVLLGGHIGIGCRHIGEIAACSGGFLATSKLNFHFRGKSAHAGKAPEKGKNALLAAAEFTVDAYALARGHDDIRVNVGKFVGGSGRNIIAADAWLEAETRGAATELNVKLCEQMEQTAQRDAGKYGVTVKMDKVGEAQTGESSPELVKLCEKNACEMGLTEGFRKEAMFGASEDVTVMMERVQEHNGQAAYFMFGAPLFAEHHHCAFDFDEEVLGIMAEFYARSVLEKQKGEDKPE